MRTPKTADFGFSFYAPYEAAVETAFLALCAARMQLEEESAPFAVRSMTFRLKSPASIRDKLTRRGLPQNAEGAAYLHDIAKPQCRTVGPDGAAHCKGPNQRGAQAARTILRRLKAPAYLTDGAVGLIAVHDAPLPADDAGSAEGVN